MADSRIDLQALDRKVTRARTALQRIDESHPRLESRIRRLVRLVEYRDRLLATAADSAYFNGRDGLGPTPETSADPLE